MSIIEKHMHTTTLAKSTTLLGIDVFELAKSTPHHIFGPTLAALQEGEAAKQSGDAAALKVAMAKLEQLRAEAGYRQFSTALDKLLSASRTPSTVAGFADWMAKRAGVGR
jgi:hypothetical protein